MQCVRKHAAKLISVSLKTDRFIRYSHQLQLQNPIDATSEIYDHVCRLFDECWKGEPLRLLGVSVSNLSREEECVQLSLFDDETSEKNQKLDEAVDKIRERFGEDAITRVFSLTPNTSPSGRTYDSDFIMMGGYKS